MGSLKTFFTYAIPVALGGGFAYQYSAARSASPGVKLLASLGGIYVGTWLGQILMSMRGGELTDMPVVTGLPPAATPTVVPTPAQVKAAIATQAQAKVNTAPVTPAEVGNNVIDIRSALDESALGSV
jgi:hypothetical protein